MTDIDVLISEAAVFIYHCVLHIDACLSFLLSHVVYLNVESRSRNSSTSTRRDLSHGDKSARVARGIDRVLQFFSLHSYSYECLKKCPALVPEVITSMNGEILHEAVRQTSQL